MFQTKLAEEITTHVVCYITFSRKTCLLWDSVKKNIVQPDRPQVKIWRMRIECWIPKATNTHSDYVILIDFKSYDVCANGPQMYVVST